VDNHWLIFVFLSYCAILARWGIGGDKGVWTVLALSGLFNLSYAGWIEDGNWLVLTAALGEFLTIKAIQMWGWNALGKRQSLILGLLWMVHLFLYLDLNLGTSMVYDRYELIIRLLATAQLILGTNGIIDLGERVCIRLRALHRIRSHGSEPA